MKVFGKTVGYHFLHTHLLSLWKPAGHIDCVDLGKDFFLVRFRVKEDYLRVLNSGPWFVGNHYLSIRCWEPNFRPSLASVSSVVVWVDTHTAAESWGGFARLYVQISLDRPLIKLLRIGGLEQLVLYKGLNALCFSCGCVGHKAEACPYHAKAQEKVGVEEREGTTVISPNQKEDNEQAFGP